MLKKTFTGLVAIGVCLVMNMDKIVGNDFERGLPKMKSVVEATAGKSRGRPSPA